MIKVYIERIGAPEVPFSLVFWPNFKFSFKVNRLFLKEILAGYEQPFFTLVSHIGEADFVAVPEEYFFACDYAPEYLLKVYAMAEKAGKKVLLFDYADYVDRIPVLPPHAVLFRVSVYRHHKREQEIVMPYFVEDMGQRCGVLPKEKGTPLVVGYCGQVEFGSTTKKLRALLRRLLQFLILHVRGDVNPKVHMRGIFWRKAALNALREGGIATRFVERSFYSLYRSTILFDVPSVRREYIENLQASHLALCVRGDANASQRFYEILSASRIPLFLDTDCVLPLEEVIAYDDFIVRVPSEALKRISDYVRVFDAAHSAGGFLEKEQLARQTYEQYLRLDRYFAYVFDRERSPYRHILF